VSVSCSCFVGRWEIRNDRTLHLSGALCNVACFPPSLATAPEHKLSFPRITTHSVSPCVMHYPIKVFERGKIIVLFNLQHWILHNLTLHSQVIQTSLGFMSVCVKHCKLFGLTSHIDAY